MSALMLILAVLAYLFPLVSIGGCGLGILALMVVP